MWKEAHVGADELPPSWLPGTDCTWHTWCLGQDKDGMVVAVGGLHGVHAMQQYGYRSATSLQVFLGRLRNRMIAAPGVCTRLKWK